MPFIPLEQYQEGMLPSRPSRATVTKEVHLNQCGVTLHEGDVLQWQEADILRVNGIGNEELQKALTARDVFSFFSNGELIKKD